MIVLLWAHRDAPLSPRASSLSYAFGPGPITPAVKWIIIANIAMYVATLIYQPIIIYLGLIPRRVVTERRGSGSSAPTCSCMAGRSTSCSTCSASGCSASSSSECGGRSSSRAIYAVTGIGAGLTVIGVGLLPFEATDPPTSRRHHRRIRCALRPPAGVRAVLPRAPDPDVSALPGPGEVLRDDPRRAGIPGVARAARCRNAAHLGGLMFGYLYLRGGRGGLTRRNQVPLPEVEDEPPAPQVRRLLRRPLRLGPSRPLKKSRQFP